MIELDKRIISSIGHLGAYFLKNGNQKEYYLSYQSKMEYVESNFNPDYQLGCQITVLNISDTK